MHFSWRFRLEFGEYGGEILVVLSTVVKFPVSGGNFIWISKRIL